MADQIDQREDTLYNIAAYLRIIAAGAVKSRAGDVLDKWEKAMAYSKLDGSTSQMKIATSLNVPPRTVANWSDEFVRYNLVAAPSKYNSSHKALFSLDELGIDVASLKKKYQKPATESAATEGAGENGDINGKQDT